MSVGGLERIAFAGISVQDVTETEPMHGWSDRAIARECSGEGGGGKTWVHSHFILFNYTDLPIVALAGFIALLRTRLCLVVFLSFVVRRNSDE